MSLDVNGSGTANRQAGKQRCPPAPALRLRKLACNYRRSRDRAAQPAQAAPSLTEIQTCADLCPASSVPKYPPEIQHRSQYARHPQHLLVNINCRTHQHTSLDPRPSRSDDNRCFRRAISQTPAQRTKLGALRVDAVLCALVALLIVSCFKKVRWSLIWGWTSLALCVNAVPDGAGWLGGSRAGHHALKERQLC